MRRLALALLATPALGQEAPTWADLGPFFQERCAICHAGEGAPLGLRLDAYATALAGSEDGPVLVAGDPAGSELIRRVRGISQPAMPLVGEPLTEAEIARIEAWVLAGLPEGAPAPIAEAPAAPGPDDPVTFAHVAPILLQRCVKCHSDVREGGPPEGLRLDTLAGVLAGGERVVVVPGNPDASEIVRRVEGTAQPRMPFDGPPWLSDDEIALIRRWIAGGAPDAEGIAAPMPTGGEVRYRGTLTAPGAIDGVPFVAGPDTRVDDAPGVGGAAELRGVVRADGTIEATRLRDR